MTFRGNGVPHGGRVEAGEVTNLRMFQLAVVMFGAVVAWMAYALVTGDRRLGRWSLWAMGIAYALGAFALWRENREQRRGR